MENETKQARCERGALEPPAAEVREAKHGDGHKLACCAAACRCRLWLMAIGRSRTQRNTSVCDAGACCLVCLRAAALPAGRVGRVELRRSMMGSSRQAVLGHSSKRKQKQAAGGRGPLTANTGTARPAKTMSPLSIVQARRKSSPHARGCGLNQKNAANTRGIIVNHCCAILLHACPRSRESPHSLQQPF